MKPSFAVVGCGKVGTALEKFLTRKSVKGTEAGAENVEIVDYH